MSTLRSQRAAGKLRLHSEGSLGETCLNTGWIPSKSMLKNSHIYHQTRHNLTKRGIKGASGYFFCVPVADAHSGCFSRVDSGQPHTHPQSDLLKAKDGRLQRVSPRVPSFSSGRIRSTMSRALVLSSPQLRPRSASSREARQGLPSLGHNRDR